MSGPNIVGNPDVVGTDIEEIAKVDIVFDPSEANCATITIKDEDHTMGNSIRYMLTKNKEVDFAGYTIPHPMDNLINFRIQTQAVCPRCHQITNSPACSKCREAVQARPAHLLFSDALDQLEAVGNHVLSVFQANVDSADAMNED